MVMLLVLKVASTILMIAPQMTTIVT